MNSRLYLLDVSVQMYREGTNLHGSMEKIAIMLAGYSNATRPIYRFKVSGEGRVLAVFEVNNILGLERTVAGLWRMGGVNVVCTPLRTYEAVAQFLGVDGSLISPTVAPLQSVEKSLYWLECLGNPGCDTVNETLEKWKDGASVVLSYRAQQHLEMDIYKVVAEQKFHLFLAVEDPGDVDKLSFMLSSVLTPYGVKIHCRALQVLDDYSKKTTGSSLCTENITESNEDEMIPKRNPESIFHEQQDEPKHSKIKDKATHDTPTVEQITQINMAPENRNNKASCDVSEQILQISTDNADIEKICVESQAADLKESKLQKLEMTEVKKNNDSKSDNQTSAEILNEDRLNCKDGSHLELSENSNTVDCVRKIEMEYKSPNCEKLISSMEDVSVKQSEAYLAMSSGLELCALKSDILNEDIKNRDGVISFLETIPKDKCAISICSENNPNIDISNIPSSSISEIECESKLPLQSEKLESNFPNSNDNQIILSAKESFQTNINVNKEVTLNLSKGLNCNLYNEHLPDIKTVGKMSEIQSGKQLLPLHIETQQLNLQTKENFPGLRAKDALSDLQAKGQLLGLQTGEKMPDLQIIKHLLGPPSAEHVPNPPAADCWPDPLKSEHQPDPPTADCWPDPLTAEHQAETSMAEQQAETPAAEHQAEAPPAECWAEALTAECHPEAEYHPNPSTAKHWPEAPTAERCPNPPTVTCRPDPLTAKHCSDPLTAKHCLDPLTAERHPEAPTDVQHLEALKVKHHPEAPTDEYHPDPLTAECCPDPTVECCPEAPTAVCHPDLKTKDLFLDLPRVDHLPNLQKVDHPSGLKGVDSMLDLQTTDCLPQPQETNHLLDLKRTEYLLHQQNTDHMCSQQVEHLTDLQQGKKPDLEIAYLPNQQRVPASDPSVRNKLFAVEVKKQLPDIQTEKHFSELETLKQLDVQKTSEKFFGVKVKENQPEMKAKEQLAEQQAKEQTSQKLFELETLSSFSKLIGDTSEIADSFRQISKDKIKLKPVIDSENIKSQPKNVLHHLVKETNSVSSLTSIVKPLEKSNSNSEITMTTTLPLKLPQSSSSSNNSAFHMKDNIFDDMDLTDSQICVSELSDNEQFSDKGKLFLQPQTKEIENDGTKIVKDLIKELAQLNKFIIRSQREMENAFRQKRNAQSTSQNIIKKQGTLQTFLGKF
ncbi:Hypothetical predicted protein [Octopus vulgaris]|uniref:Uncharacterized protein n=1 Tax=Octopus vulgaris TaxID=6645 RepID=A0AA36AIS1_OCTVU|nr:Hypothetical predicted protein [Octopus vulgaris]